MKLVVKIRKTKEKTNEVRSDWRITQSINKFKTRTCYDIYLLDMDEPVDEFAPENRLPTSDGMVFYNQRKRFYKKSELKHYVKSLGISKYEIWDHWFNKCLESIEDIPVENRELVWTDYRCEGCGRLPYRRKDGREYLYQYKSEGPLVCKPNCHKKCVNN